MNPRHNVIRLWKARISKYENNIQYSVLDRDKDMWQRQKSKLQVSLDKLQAMSDKDFYLRFLVGSECLSEL